MSHAAARPRISFAGALKVSTAFCISCLLLTAHPCLANAYDLVLTGGHVIDPANGIDKVTNLGVTKGKVAAVTDTAITGKQTIDATGLIVSPGFIDLHSHAVTIQGQYFQAKDGVTTALELEAGFYPVEHIETLLTDQGSINYGASVSHLAIRQHVMGNVLQAHPLLPSTVDDADTGIDKTAAYISQANDDQIAQMESLLDAGLNAGGLGIGFLIDYLSVAISDAELSMVFGVAARHQAPVFTHIRRGLPGDTAGLLEVIEEARRSGSALHICHLNASAMGGVEKFLQIIESAQASGVDVTTEAYPYNAGSTTIGAAVFGRDWQRIFGIEFGDVEWPATGERLTAETFAEKRKTDPGGLVIHHYGKEEWTRQALQRPGVIIASDAMPITKATTGIHPRGIGTFSRFLSRYTASGDAEGTLTLSQAIAKITSLPAHRLARVAPTFNNKGHLAVGADADITVFDPQRIQDLATYQHPLTPSEGVAFVVVNGEIVIAKGNRLPDIHPGQLILGGDDPR